MKGFRIFILLSVFMSIVSCAKNNSTPSNNNNSNTNTFSPYMTASLDGGSWKARSDSGQLSGSDNATIFGANGISLIYLDLSSLSPATYTLTSGGTVSINYSPDGIGLFKSDSGSITITSYSSADNTITGTFAGRLNNGNGGGHIYRITNGKFAASLHY